MTYIERIAHTTPAESVGHLPTTDRRPLELIGRATSLRHDHPSEPGDSDGYLSVIRELLNVVVPEYCDVCAVNLPDGGGEPTQLVLRHRDFDDLGDEGETYKEAQAALLEMVPDLATVSSQVLETGRTAAWSDSSNDGGHHCVVVPLLVNERAIGTMIFARDIDGDAFESDDVTAAEHAGWILSSAIERVVLRRDARSAIRRTQRIATQLHQLIATSITVTGLRSEQDILIRLVSSARDVYSVEEAFVSLESGPFAPLCAVVVNGGDAVCLSPLDPAIAHDMPVSRPGFTSPWTDRDWLVAPLFERRNVTRGVIAIRRLPGSDFGAEEREVLALLAQMASSALGAEELNRIVQRSESRLRILVDSAPVGIVEVNAEGDVRWWNRAASRVFAWPTYDDARATTSPHFPDATLPGLRELWDEVLGHMDVAGRDFVDVEIAGRVRVLAASATLLPASQGEAPALLTLIDDVTNHRELKAELRHAHTMEVRGQVASRIAHDFNNLLTLISGHAEMLATDLAGRERELQMVRDIQVTASRASLLTTQLQTIGRTKTAAPVVFDPVAIIESNAEVLERILGSSIEVTWSLDRRAGNVRIDADQFEQMILNLVINARDAMIDGGELAIATESITLDEVQPKGWDVPSGAYVLLRITDTGAGMDDETRRRCFEPLFTTKGPFKGTGLGLTSARRVVEESGGAIRCLSKVGEGSTFEILLPVVDDVAQEVSSSDRLPPPPRSETVLLAEDDDDLRRFMSQILRRNGYVVLEANSAEAALAVAEEQSGAISILLSDVVMGEMSGGELAATLQKVRPTLRVLLVSGTADDSVLEHLAPRSSAFLSKPFRPSQLIDSLHALLRRRD